MPLIPVCEVSVNVPLAATKPSPMLMPSVPPTLSGTSPERPKPKLVPPVPSIVRSDQLSGVVPAVALFTLTSRLVTNRSMPGMPTSEAEATVSRTPV